MATKGTILIVDDSANLSDMLDALLKRRNYDVKHARDGGQGLEMLRTWRASVSCVVLDLMMPKVDGAGFLDVWSADPELKTVPVVILSGSLDAEAVAERYGIKVALKPSGPLKLFELVEKVIAEKRASDPGAGGGNAGGSSNMQGAI